MILLSVLLFFSILSVDVENQTLGLRIVWPKTWEGKEFEPKVLCDQITSYTKDGGKIILGKPEFFIKVSQEIESNPDEDGDLFFSALCSDSSCKEIVSDCYLSLP